MQTTRTKKIISRIENSSMQVTGLKIREHNRINIVECIIAESAAGIPLNRIPNRQCAIPHLSSKVPVVRMLAFRRPMLGIPSNSK